MPELSDLFPPTCPMGRLVPGDIIMNNDLPHKVVAIQVRNHHAPDGGFGESGPFLSAEVRLDIRMTSDEQGFYTVYGRLDEPVQMVTYSGDHKKRTLDELEWLKSQILKERDPEWIDVRFTFTRDDEDRRLDLHEIKTVGKSIGVTDSDLRSLADSMGQTDRWQVTLSRMGEVISGDTITG